MQTHGFNGYYIHLFILLLKQNKGILNLAHSSFRELIKVAEGDAHNCDNQSHNLN